MKAKLPIKTQIAMWWTFIIGFGSIAIMAFLSCSPEPEYSDSAWIGITLGCLYILPGVLLYMKNKLAWASALVILSVELILWLGYLVLNIVDILKNNQHIFDDITFLIFPVLLMLIPTILVVLDRKNYFEMVRQMNLAKKREKGNS